MTLTIPEPSLTEGKAWSETMTSVGSEIVDMLVSLFMTSLEAEFLDLIGTKVLRVFLLANHNHLY
jgi:hypothetical protein